MTHHARRTTLAVTWLLAACSVATDDARATGWGAVPDADDDESSGGDGSGEGDEAGTVGHDASTSGDDGGTSPGDVSSASTTAGDEGDGGDDDGGSLPPPNQPDPDDGPCGCGFPENTCTPGYVDPEGTEGPFPPLCGGGSGRVDGTPTECFGGNFGTYGDVDSFCEYVIGRWTYLENECGNFGTATLSIDAGLAQIAQDEANAVADGAYPKGYVTCGGSPCGPQNGPMFNLSSGAHWMYIDGLDGNGIQTSDAMFTAAESMMIIQSNPTWFYQDGTPIYERACQFTSEFANATFYHYCNWDGQGVYGDPSTQPSRIGCGTAVDSEGITWRVVKLGA